MTDRTEDQLEAEDCAPEKTITNSRWQNESPVPRYGRDEQRTLDEINSAITPGFFRGARIPKGN